MSAVWFPRWWKHPARPARPVRRRRAQLDVERLEDRCVPSIHMVTNLSGSAAVSGSLPFEVAQAAPGDAIQFAANLNGGTITLGQTLDINKNLTIDGAGSGITVNGNGSNRVLQIEFGNTVVISGLTITGGHVGGFNGGGGLYNLGSLTLSNSTVTGDSAYNGGGIFNGSNGTMVMSGDTVNNNTAVDAGGGIDNDGNLTIINSTIAANAAYAGGGMFTNGVLMMGNSTVASNTVTGINANGGGIDDFGGELDLLNTIVYNPNSGAATNNEVLGTITQVQGDLFGFGAIKVAPGGDHGGGFYGFNPQLGPLQNNGGPTATMALLPASHAIGVGANSSLIPGLTVPTTDQRGDPRPASSIDIGAFQTQTQAPAITSASNTTFDEGTAGTFTVTATGSPTPSLSESGPLPNGVKLTDNGNGTATLAGTPTVAGQLSITITASNGAQPNAAQTFILTVLTPHQRFVEALYTDFLHRPGDLNNPNDAGYWVTLLDQGAPATTVASGVGRSPEGLGVAVDGLYQRFLGRNADPAGRAGFVAYLEAAGTLEGVSQAMLASAEYQSHFPTDSAFVQSLYQNLLQRTGSTAEVGGWLAQLPQLGRAGVAQGFLSSQEYRDLEVVDDYTQLLDRTQPPSAAEVDYWFGTGLDILTLDIRIAASAEYQTNG